MVAASAGVLMGFDFYWQQLVDTPWYLWPVVPDCPLFMLLGMVALVITTTTRRSPTFDLVVAVGLIKFAVWTWMVVLIHPDQYLDGTNDTYWYALLALHAGQALMAFPIIIDAELPNRAGIVIATAIALLFDLFDYAGDSIGLENTVPISTRGLQPGISVLSIVTPISTIIVTTWVLIILRSRKGIEQITDRR